jgi:hypothetical protein
MRWTRNVARIEEMRYTYKILIGNPEGKSPTGRTKRRREDNKMYLSM